MFFPLFLKKPQVLLAGRLEALVSQHCIPYTAPVDQYTLKTLEGGMLQTLRLAGLAFETADHSEINLRKVIRNQLWKSFDSSRFAVYYHIVRRHQTERPEGEFDPGFACELNAAWEKQLAGKSQYTNELYLTLVRKQGDGLAHKSQDLFGRFLRGTSKEELAHSDEQGRKELDNAVMAVAESLKSYWPERLRMVETPDGRVLCEQMRFLGFLLNLAERDYLVPQRPISELLATTRPVFQHETIELRYAARTAYAAMLSVKEYDSKTGPCMMDRLLCLPQQFVMTQSFRFEERAQSIAQIEQQRRRLRASGDKARSQVGELDGAMDEICSGAAGFGLHHMTMLVWDESRKTLADRVATVDAALGEQGITCVREDVNLEAAFYAQLPGNFRFITRGARISTKNFASFASCHNYAMGRRRGLWGPAITVLSTESGTPYFMNLHVADRGNTLVLGPTGQGKTLTLSFLLAQSLKLGGRRVLLDKDRGMEIFVRALGGSYFRIEDGYPTGWNPLQWSNSEQARAFLPTWFESLLADPSGLPLDAEARQLIGRVVTALADLPFEHRRLRNVAPLFGNPEQNILARRLLDWYVSPEHGQGRFAWLFDNEQQDLDFNRQVIGFDLTKVLDNPTSCVPTMLWLFFVVESLLYGKPLAILIDEGWRMLQDEAVARWVENFEFTIRKNNGLIIFTTQAPETLMGTKMAASVKQQSETMILFPNPKAEESVYCGFLGLSKSQFGLIRHVLPARGQPGWFLVINSLGAAVCRLDMTGLDDFVAVLSGNRNTVALLGDLIAEYGEAPETWLPLFRERWKDCSLSPKKALAI